MARPFIFNKQLTDRRAPLSMAPITHIKYSYYEGHDSLQQEALYLHSDFCMNRDSLI